MRLDYNYFWSTPISEVQYMSVSTLVVSETCFQDKKIFSSLLNFLEAQDIEEVWSNNFSLNKFKFRTWLAPQSNHKDANRAVEPYPWKARLFLNVVDFTRLSWLSAQVGSQALKLPHGSSHGPLSFPSHDPFPCSLFERGPDYLRSVRQEEAR